ncbi:sugar ABC transporter substrate-binding protein [Nocardiopsis trehalosi]|jgi:N,N'-diacetylchitobiose transport system substrate-binding protein|uniref:sugar ABC transporter substrate-binding protein n=1 Tax=Nocardiopsis trehalosi TaxID=109329 RepID=UPI00082CD9BA|nr:sugar ABC transporter substrate-binding protein [Nocardiopsis trehalosi]
MARTHVLPVAALVATLSLVATSCGGGEGGGEGATLDVWIMEGTNPDATAYFDEVAAQFTEQTGAEVNVEFVPWADAHEKFVTAMAGGTMPDVAEVGTTWTPEFADAGGLIDLTERAGDTAAYSEGLVEAGTVDGQLYGLPWYAGVRSVVYRTDVFEELDLEEPTTWEELRETAITIAEERDDITAFPVPGDAEYSLMPFVWGAGGEIAVEEGGTWTSGIDSAEAREGISFYTDLALEDGVSSTGATTWKETDVQDNFISGDVAMAISGSWTPTAILEAAPDLEGKIDAFPIPGPEGGYSPSFLGGSHLAMFNGTEDEDLAWEYIQLLTNEDNAARWSEETTYFPGKQDQITPYTESDDPLVQPFALQMAESGKGVPATQNYGKVQGEMVLQTMVQAILNGDASVEEATATAAEDIESILNEGS